MKNFNIKEYVYEKRAIGLTNTRIAETLGITVDELNTILEDKVSVMTPDMVPDTPVPGQEKNDPAPVIHAAVSGFEQKPVKEEKQPFEKNRNLNEKKPKKGGSWAE